MRKALFLFLVLVLVVSGVMPVFAQGTVDTVAVISGGGAGNEPVVKAAWTLSYDPGPGLNDDPNTPGLQVTPALSTSPTVIGTREICVYAVVRDPNGVGNIDWAFTRVYEPDGSIKYNQLVMQRSHDAAFATPLINAGAATQQLGTATAAELIDEIRKGDADLFWVCWEYDNHQAPGDYRSLVNVFDLQTNQGQGTAWTTILPLYMLNVDFNTVNYGSVVPGSYKSIMGDRIWDPPASAYPTIWNSGNANASLTLRWSSMLGQTWFKRIIRFDARLSDFNPIQYVTADAVPAGNGPDGVAGTADDYLTPLVTLPGPFLPCTPTQIDFSIVPVPPPGEPGLPPDTYNGLLWLGFIAA